MLKPEANPHITELTYLKRKPNPERALGILQRLTKSVSYLMKKHKLKVRTLAEFYPTDRTLLGLNVNGGLKIMLRLRSPSDHSVFLNEDAIMETLIHELVHNTIGPHNEKFYERYELLRADQWSIERQGLFDHFLGTGRRLGGKPLRARGSKGFVGKGSRLGGSTVVQASPREMVRWAINRRYNSEKSLLRDKEVDIDAVLRAHDLMESQNTVISLLDDDDTNGAIGIHSNKELPKGREKPLCHGSTEVIDLT